MKRLLAGLTVAVVALATAVPAWAHEEIDPATVPTGIPMFLNFSVANEKTVELRSIRLIAPRDLEFGAGTREPAGWTATKSNAAITWTGAIKPAKFETFGFEIESANQPGDKTYTVTLTFADNSTENADVTLKVVPATTGAGDAAGNAATDDGEDSDSGGGTALAAVALALSAAALALAVIAFTRSRKAGGPAAGPAGSGSGEKQDW